MIISNDYPPNFKDIVEVFPDVRTSPIIFCYGDTIYNPNGLDFRKEHVVHEEVHSKQQGDDPEEWWRKYLIDPSFRIHQEIPAYSAQLRYIRKTRNLTKTQQARYAYAKFLSSPVYGNAISFDDAYEAIHL